MMRDLFRVLLRPLSLWHFGGAMLAATAGLMVVMAVVQSSVGLNRFFEEEDSLLQPEYLVINKEVSIFKTLKLSKSGFSESELDDLRQQPFISEVAPFVANRFKVSAYTKASDQIPPFYTELFFESVPDRFLDVDQMDFRWQPEKKMVPIVVPSDYLRLYNFGFAQSQGLPQLSPGMIGLVSFNLRLEGQDGKRIVLQGRVAGFSDRLNTILVPEAFMEWAHERLQTERAQDPSRIILVTDDPGDPELGRFLDRKGYEVPQDKLKSGRVQQLLRLLLAGVGGFGLLLIGLSLLVFFLSFELLLSRSVESLQRLIRLGYDYRLLAGYYTAFYAAVLLLVFLVAWLLLAQLVGVVSVALDAAGFPLFDGLDASVIGSGLLVLLVLFAGYVPRFFLTLKRLV